MFFCDSVLYCHQDVRINMMLISSPQQEGKICPSVATFYSGVSQSASATGSVNHFSHLLEEQHLCLVLQSRHVRSNFGQEVCKNSTLSN